MGWRDTIAWLADNDDTTWVDYPAIIRSPVTAALAADVFGKTTDDVRAAILRYRAKAKPRKT